MKYFELRNILFLKRIGTIKPGLKELHAKKITFSEQKKGTITFEPFEGESFETNGIKEVLNRCLTPKDKITVLYFDGIREGLPDQTKISVTFQKQEEEKFKLLESNDNAGTLSQTKDNELCWVC